MRHGTTHVLLADEQYVQVKLSPDRATTTCYGNTCETQLYEGATGNAKRASYVLVRVAPGNWGRLPEALRPVPVDSVEAEVEESIRVAVAGGESPRHPPSLQGPESSVAGRGAGQLSIPEIARIAKASVVVIRTDKGGQGSGFSISKRGLVATSFHVVVGAQAVVIEDPNGTAHRVSGIRAFDQANDLAILEAPTLKLPGLPIATRVPEAGEALVVVGHPQGMTATVSNGIVAAVRDFPDGISLLQFTAPISQGSSGGPILNTDGHVVGVSRAILRAESQNINFASTSTALARLATNAPAQPMPMARFAAIAPGGSVHEERATAPPTTHSGKVVPDRPPFPQTVAGFNFGATVADARVSCSESKAHERITWLRTDQTWAECPFLPVPLYFAAPPVGLTFYAGQLANVVFQARSFDQASGALVAKYGEPDAFFTYRADTKAWVETQVWREGEPGGVLWNLRGGTVQMGSLDGATIIVRYVPAAAHALENDNY